MSLENLKPRQKGLKPRQKGMPKVEGSGRKKGTPNRSTIVAKWLAEMDTVTNPITKLLEKMTVEDAIVLAMLAKAKRGDISATRFLYDQRYGLQTQKIENEISAVETKTYKLPDGTVIEL
jgi:hypothetical protein